MHSFAIGKFRRDMMAASLVSIAAVGVLFSAQALAGPPLICFPLEIDDADSLPWGDNPNDPFTGDKKFDVKDKLVGATLTILAPDTPILVRMETMRRASLYGTGNRTTAFELLAALQGRVLDAEADGKPDALAWFDAGYLAQSYEQVGLLQPSRRPSATRHIGYDWAAKAMKMRPDDPELAFGVAMILNWGSGRRAVEGYQAEQDRCLRIALKGTKANMLLKQNIEGHFGMSVDKLSRLVASKG